MGRLTLLKVGIPQAQSYNDDFSGSSLNPKWTEYDPLGDITVSVGGGVLTVSVPANVDHDWYTGINAALRLKQTYTGSANFTIQALYTTTMTAGYTFHGLVVGTDNDNGIRFDLVYDPNVTIYAAVTQIDSAVATGLQYTSTGGTPSQPYYLKLVKSGTSYTPSYSANGSSWTDYGPYTWAGTINYIGLIVGNTGAGGSAPAFTTTCDSFTYTAN